MPTKRPKPRAEAVLQSWKIEISFLSKEKKLKDMDLDLDHFLNLEQLITGDFTDTV